MAAQIPSSHESKHDDPADGDRDEKKNTWGTPGEALAGALEHASTGKDEQSQMNKEKADERNNAAGSPTTTA